MDRTDDFMAAIVRMRGDVEQLKRLGASRWGAANPKTAWGVIDVKTVTAAQNGIAAVADITGLSSTFTAVANRRYRYTLMVPVTVQQTATGIQTASITDGSNVVKGSTNNTVVGASQAFSIVIAFETPAAGSTTRKGRMATTAGTVDLAFGATLVGSFCVEDVGPA
jgi:hypothetical protein